MNSHSSAKENLRWTSVRLASKYILDEPGRKSLLGEEWETVYETVEQACQVVQTFVREKQIQVQTTRRSLESRKRAPNHWSELAPHSPVAVLAAQVAHLKHVESLIDAVLTYCSSSSSEEPSGGGASVDGAVTIANVIASMMLNTTVKPMLRQCVVSEEDLRRREEFARLMEWGDGKIAGSSDESVMATSLRSLAQHSPIRSRTSQQLHVINELVHELCDATTELGRKTVTISRAVDGWLWEGFSPAAVGEQLGLFVDETVSEVKYRPEVASLELTEDVLIAAVEDELYAYDHMFQPLLKAFQQPAEDDAIVCQMARYEGAPQASLHVPEMYVAHDVLMPYAEAIGILRSISLYRTPTRKLLVIKQAAKRLLVEMKRVAITNGIAPEKIIVGGDDFIPSFMYVALQSGIVNLCTQVSFLRHCLPNSLHHGELGYYATTLEFACEFIKNMAMSTPVPLSSLQQPQWIATADRDFAYRWVCSGQVTQEDATALSPCDFVRRRCMYRRSTLNDRLEVCHLRFEPTPADDVLDVPVWLLSLRNLSDTQREILVSDNKVLSELPLEEVETVQGRRVLIPTAVEAPAAGVGASKWEACPAEALSTPSNVTLWIARRRLDESVSVNPLEFDAATRVLSDAVGESSTWQITASAHSVVPTLAALSDDPTLLAMKRCQQLLAVFTGFHNDWCDGLCCLFTRHHLQELIALFSSAAPPGHITHDEPTAATTALLSQTLTVARSSLRGALAALQNEQCLTSSSREFSMDAIHDAVLKFQRSKQRKSGANSLSISGMLDKDTLRLLRVVH